MIIIMIIMIIIIIIIIIISRATFEAVAETLGYQNKLTTNTLHPLLKQTKSKQIRTLVRGRNCSK